MTKGVTFTDKDAELVEKIIKFQHAQELPSFTAAVRILCEKGLAMSNAMETIR